MPTRRDVLKLGSAAAAVAFVGPLAAPEKGWSLDAEFGLTALHREDRLNTLLPHLKLAAATMDKADAVFWINKKLGSAFPGELFAWSIAPTGYFFTWGVPPNIYFHQMGVQIAPGSANAIGRTISVERYGSEISTTVMTGRFL